MNYGDIDNQINEIYNGTRDFPQFNQSEHAGVCSGGPFLLGRSSYVIQREKASAQVQMLMEAKRQAQVIGK